MKTATPKLPAYLINKLNNEAVKVKVLNLFDNETKPQKDISNYFYDNRDTADALKRLSYIKKRYKRVILFLSDGKFHSFDEIVNKCLGYKEELSNYDMNNWVSLLRSLRRNENGGYILDFIQDDDGVKYYRLHNPGTSSKYDGAKNIKKQTYVITKNLVPTGIAFSNYEDADNYCKNKSGYSFFDVSLFNSLEGVV